jgi:hypothetical protein
MLTRISTIPQRVASCDDDGTGRQGAYRKTIPRWHAGFTLNFGHAIARLVTTGVVALMISPRLPNTDIEKRGFSTAIDLGDIGRDDAMGLLWIRAGKRCRAARDCHFCCLATSRNVG